MVTPAAQPDARTGGAQAQQRHPSRKIVAPVLAIVLTGIAVRVPFALKPGQAYDLGQFVTWSYLAQRDGMAAVYGERPRGERPPTSKVRRWSNYPPAYLYVLRGLAPLCPVLTGVPLDGDLIFKVFDVDESPGMSAVYLFYKSPAMLVDILTALLLFALLRRRCGSRVAIGLSLAYVLLPAVVHVSAYWGQVDAFHTLFMLLSVEAAVRRRCGLMGLWAALAILTKGQSAMIAPVWLAALWREFADADFKSAARRALACLAAALATTALIVLPFLPDGRDGLLGAYFGAVGYYPYVHINAFNVWFIANPLPHVGADFSPYLRDDGIGGLGLTWRTTGLLALLVVWAYVFARMARRPTDEARFRWAVRVLPLAFFLFPTQIHERYIFPALALWIWACLPDRRWWACWLVLCFCTFVNILWVVPGTTNSPAVQWINETLHAPGVGAPIGVLCALALLAVFLLELFRPVMDARRISRIDRAGNRRSITTL